MQGTRLSLNDARRIVFDYVAHYNNVRLHSAIGYVTPKDKLEGRGKAIHAERDRRLAEARERRELERQAQQEKQSVPPQSAPSRPAIDFPAVRAAITMAAVLQLLGFRPQVQRVTGTTALEAVELVLVEVGGETTTGAGSRAMQRTRTALLAAARAVGLEAKQLTVYDAAIDLCDRLHLPLPTLPPTPHRNREEETVAPRTESNTMPSPQTGAGIP